MGLAGMDGQAAAISAKSSHSHQIPKGSVFQASSPLLRAGRSRWIGVSIEHVKEAGWNLLERRRLAFVVELGEPEPLSRTFWLRFPLANEQRARQTPSETVTAAESIPVTFLAPSFYLLPSNPCTQPVRALDANTSIPPNSQGRNLSTISNFGMAFSHSGAAWLEKRAKYLHRSLDTSPPKFGRGNLLLRLGCSGHQVRELSTELAPWTCCP